MANAILIELETTLNDLINQLSSFSEREFNQAPFENSWTAAQLGEHLRKSNFSVPLLLCGQTEFTDRAPDEKEVMLKNVFLDFSQKYVAREFNTPDQKDYQKDDLINSLSTLKEEIVSAAKSQDLARTCVSFEFPVFGYLTGLELVYLTIYHTQRHIQQLKNIQEKLRQKQMNEVVR